jgi:hypothetical protein
MTEMNGKITALDYTKKTVTLKDELGAIHVYQWTDSAKDEYFHKQNVGYYQTIKYNPDTYIIEGAHFWKEGKEVMSRLPDNNPKFPPRKPRVTIGFTIAIAQYENVKVEVEGKDTAECKTLLGEALDSLAPNHEPTKDLIQRFKGRLL